MADSLGKQFEQKFKENFISTFPDCFLYRLHDQVSGYKTVSQNICDYIAFVKDTLYLIECKTHSGNTFPLSNLTQYDDLLKFAGKQGIRAGIVLWMYEKDIDVLYIPIRSIKKMIDDGKKSFNVKMLGTDEYKIVKVPGKKKRKFIDSDYTVLRDLEDGD